MLCFVQISVALQVEKWITPKIHMLCFVQISVALQVEKGITPKIYVLCFVQISVALQVEKWITPKIHMLCFVQINNVLFNILRVSTKGMHYRVCVIFKQPSRVVFSSRNPAFLLQVKKINIYIYNKKLRSRIFP